MQRLNKLLSPAHSRELVELRKEIPRRPISSGWRLHNPPNRFMRRRLGAFEPEEELLGNLFTRTKADELDIHILADRQAVQLDEIRSKVDDAYGIPHVQDEDIGGLRPGRGLEHKLNGLGHRHKEPRRFGMCDRDRAAR